MRLATIMVACLVVLVATGADGARPMNGFDVSDATVPLRLIQRGGPPRDGIPAINTPRFVAASDALMDAADRVLGLTMEGVARAYPISILNWHEVVNDRVRGHPVLVSYCPLCGSGMAFDAMVDDRPLTFGVSGLLYNSDVLFYDRETQSLWSQISRHAISGPLRGQRLHQLSLDHTSWADWLSRHPDTTVLRPPIPNARDYGHDPYQDYEKTRRLYFDVAPRIPRTYHTKERVLGLAFDGHARAYPFVELREHGRASFTDRLADREFTVHWNGEHDTARVTDRAGTVTTTIAYWFAWYAFHPDTEVFEAMPVASPDARPASRPRTSRP